MPRPTISDIRNNLTDFQKLYYWNIQWLRKPAFVTISDVDLNHRCISTDVPKRTGETAEVRIRGNIIPDPGIYATGGTIVLTLLETSNSPIREFIREWEEACATKKGKFKELSGDIRLTTSDNQENDNYEYQLLWCFLEDSETPPLDGGTSDPMQPTITIRYTDFKRKKLRG